VGQKIHPRGFRLGISKDWKSHWHAEREFKNQVLEDAKIRKLIREKVGAAGIDRIEINRSISKLEITIYVARPGMVIGRGGSKVEELKKELTKITGQKPRLNIEEVGRHEVSAALTAEDVVQQLERRFHVRRVLNNVADRVMEKGAKGVRIIAAGRLGGVRIARSEKVSRGSVPLQTLRADVDFARRTAHGPAGTIGVKVWIYRGEKEF
jgi:small subunit ribosomal protein S3